QTWLRTRTLVVTRLTVTRGAPRTIRVYKADSSGRRNTMTKEVAMTIRKRRSDRSVRGPLLSPGRPPVAGRDERRRFWAAIAAGMASEVAAIRAGVPQAVGTRWFRKAGGMPPAMFARIGEASLRPISLVCRARGDRAPSRAGHHDAGSRSPARAG